MTVASMKRSSILQGVAEKGGFDASVTITASDATWTVPSLGSPVVKVTVIGGGGGGGGVSGTSAAGAGGTGGTTTFDAGAPGTITATGGLGAVGGTNAGNVGTAGLASGNGGQASNLGPATQQVMAGDGAGGEINVSYLNLTGVSSVDVTIGAGGTGGTGNQGAGGAGGRGEVIVEYVAGA